MNESSILSRFRRTVWYDYTRSLVCTLHCLSLTFCWFPVLESININSLSLQVEFKISFRPQSIFLGQWLSSVGGRNVLPSIASWERTPSVEHAERRLQNNMCCLESIQWLRRTNKLSVFVSAWLVSVSSLFYMECKISTMFRNLYNGYSRIHYLYAFLKLTTWNKRIPDIHQCSTVRLIHVLIPKSLEEFL